MTIIRDSALILPGADNVNAPAIGIDNKVTTSNVTTTTADADYPVTNLANPATFLEWRGTHATNAENVEIDSLTGDVNYVGVARHNLGTAGRTIKIQGDTGSGYADLTTTYAPTDDKPFMFLFDSDEYTDIKLVISSGTALVRMAVLNVGLTVALQRNIYVGHTPITLGHSQRTVNGRSENGNFLGRIVVSETKATKLSMENLTEAWVRSMLEPFLVSARTLPFFFGWRPDDFPAELGFVWLSNDPQPANEKPNGLMSFDMSMTGIVE